MSLLHENRPTAPYYAWTRQEYYERQRRMDELRASTVVERVSPNGETAERLPTLEDLIRPPAWHAFALCRGQGVAAFFPERGVDSREVKALCAACPAREACAADALATGTNHGIWGGLSGRERRQLRRLADVA